jgi:DNA-binding response OmpR family regulator
MPSRSRKHHGRGLADSPTALTTALEAGPLHQEGPRQARPVLLIGNDPALMAFLREILWGQGLKTIVSSRMSAAFVALVKYRPAVVCFVNLKGYGSDLPQFLALLPATLKQKRVPVIIMSTDPLGDKELVARLPGFLPGYDAYLPKPALSGDILACVRRAISLA